MKVEVDVLNTHHSNLSTARTATYIRGLKRTEAETSIIRPVSLPILADREQEDTTLQSR